MVRNHIIRSTSSIGILLWQQLPDNSHFQVVLSVHTYADCSLVGEDYPVPKAGTAWTKTIAETTMRNDPVQRRDWRATHSVKLHELETLGNQGLNSPNAATSMRRPPSPPPPVGTVPFSELLDKLEQKRAGAGRLFRYLDLNRNGKVDAGELAEGIATIGMGKHDIERLMKGLGSHLDGGTTVSLRQFAEFLNGPAETYRHRFEPQLYQHHDYTKLKRRVEKESNQLHGSYYGMQMNEDVEDDGVAEETEPSLRDLETLGRVLRDKIAARTRAIDTILRQKLQHADRTGCGKITGGECQAVLGRLGLHVSREDMKLIVGQCEVDGDKAIHLDSLLNWLLPDNDHDNKETVRFR